MSTIFKSTRMSHFSKICIKLIIFLIVTTLLAGCSNNKSDREKIIELCDNYAMEYSVKKENSNGTYEISIAAPDFAVIAEQILKDDPNLTYKSMKKLIKNSPDSTKTYTIVVGQLNDEEIQTSFRDQVIHDLMIQAISNSKYVEGDELKK